MIIPKYTLDDFKKLPLRAIVAFAARCRAESNRLPFFPMTIPSTRGAGWR